MFRALLIICLIFLLSIAVMAQDGYPLPDDLVPIESDSAVRLQHLATMGSLLQGQLMWSPDGTKLVVATSADVRLYDATDFSAVPIIIPDAPETGSPFNFNAAGELVINGQRWDVQTGTLLGTIAPPTVRSTNIITGVSVEVIKSNGQVMNLSLEGNFRLHDAIFTPDETRMALLFVENEKTSFRSLLVQLWDTEAGTLIREMPLTLELIAEFTFHADGQLLLAGTVTSQPYGSRFEDIQIWNTRTGQEIMPDNYDYLPLVFSPDAELLAFATERGISLWHDDTELGLIGHVDGYISDYRPYTFGLDSKTLVTSRLNEVVLWSVDGQSIPAEPSLSFPADNDIGEIIYSPNESLLATSTSEYLQGFIEVWNAESGTLVSQLTPEASLNGGRFSSNGQRLLGKDTFNNFLIWDVATGSLKTTLPFHTVINNDLSSAAYWEKGVVRIVDVLSGAETEIPVIENYLGNVIAFSSNAELVYFAGRDFVGFDLANGEQVFRKALTEDNGNPRVTFSADSHYVLTAIRPRSIAHDRVTTPANVWETSNLEQPIAQMNISPYRSLLLSPQAHYVSELQGGCGDGGGGLYYLRSSTTEDVINHGTGSCGPYSHVFTPDEKWVLVGWDRQITAIDIVGAYEELAASPTGFLPYPSQNIYNFIPAIGASLQAQTLELELNQAGSLLAVMVSGYEYEDELGIRLIEIWHLEGLLQSYDTQTRPEPILTINDANQAVFSPDSQYLATDIGIWHLAIGEQVAAFNSTVTAFSSDGALLATYAENTVTLWDVSVLEHGHGDAALVTLNIEDVQELAFNPDSTLLYIKRSGDIQVWGVASQ